MEFVLVESEEEIDKKILEELEVRQESMRELEKDLIDLSAIWIQLADMLGTQGQSLMQVNKKVEKIENTTSEVITNLEKASSFVKDKFVIARDITIIASGAILGATGLFFGPLIGVGTIVAGVGAGSAAVAGIHKMDP